MLTIGPTNQKHSDPLGELRPVAELKKEGSLSWTELELILT